MSLVDDVNLAHIATVLPDGAPHSVPVWVGREGDRIAVLTAPGSRKAKNLALDPRVALSIVDHRRPTSTELIRGRVVETVTGDAAWEIIDRIARKYTGGPYPLREDRIVFLIEVERAREISF